jgi:hypothetical protein
MDPLALEAMVLAAGSGLKPQALSAAEGSNSLRVNFVSHGQM